MKETTVTVGSQNADKSDIHLLPGQNLYTGINKFTEEFGTADSLEEDLFNLASGIYGSDLAVKREERERYIRTIELSVEVVNLHLFERVRNDIERSLFVVSKDNWKIRFLQKEGTPVTTFKWQKREGAVLLFSGGIDSMCAATEFVKEKRELVLVSHNSHMNHVVDACQNNIHDTIEKHYKTKIRHIHIKVYGRNHNGYPFLEPNLRENTQRTRSFLFLTLAALVTRRCEFNKVLFMAENGQFAIHLPLNSARVGPFSTHTADPEFVARVQKIFQTLLGNSDFEIQNPFLYKTKAEVFELLPDKLKKETRASASCWMIQRLSKHCGYCIPCISRRIAFEYNGISFKEYETDLFRTDTGKLEDTNDRRRNLNDYLEFIAKFKDVTDATKYDLREDFPELYNTAFDFDNAVSMYQRVAAQSLEVFKKYPHVLKLI